MIVSEYIGGDSLQYSQKKNMLVITNTKKKTIILFDLRKNEIIQSTEVKFQKKAK